MNIPKDLMAAWKKLKSPDDAQQIISKYNSGPGKKSVVNKSDISRAFSLQRCSDDVFEAIASFYKEKAEMIKKYMI